VAPRDSYRVAMIRTRVAWLGRPWFLAAVALLALNDRVLKAAWPGLATGKLSDLAGVVVLATLASVLLRRTLGTTLTAVAFVALKTVPGVAELAAPVLGGVTLRDPWDLLALLALPVLWAGLGRDRPDQRARDQRARQVLGALAAVVATTATSAPPTGVTEVGAADGLLHAAVYVEHVSQTRWLATFDGGATWVREDPPEALVEPDQSGPEGVQACAEDGVCYRVRYQDGSPSRTPVVVERREPGGKWVVEGRLPGRGGYAEDLAVNPDDSGQAVVAHDETVSYRAGGGSWREVDLVALATPDQWPRDWTAVVGTPRLAGWWFIGLSLFGWLLGRPLAVRIVLQALNVGGWLAAMAAGGLTSAQGLAALYCAWLGLVVGVVVVSRLTSRHSRGVPGLVPPGFDPPNRAR